MSYVISIPAGEIKVTGHAPSAPVQPVYGYEYDHIFIERAVIHAAIKGNGIRAPPGALTCGP